MSNNAGTSNSSNTNASIGSNNCAGGGDASSSSNNSTTCDRFTAGFKILSKFQNQWEQLHVKSESNVSKAKTALSKIDKLERDTTRRLNALGQFIECYKSLSKLGDHIKSIDNDLKSLESCFVQIENSLIVLKEHKEQKSN